MKLKVNRYYKESDLYACHDIEKDRIYYFDFHTANDFKFGKENREDLVGCVVETNDYFPHCYIANDPKVIAGEVEE